MLIDNYRHIHIYENCSADMLSVNFFDPRDVTHFLAVYKGAEPGQPGPSQKCRLAMTGLTLTVLVPGPKW